MPRFYFHLVGPTMVHLDDVGVELPDDAMAWSQAVRSCGELLRDLNGRMPDQGELTLRVEDEARQPIAQLRINAARQASSL